MPNDGDLLDLAPLLARDTALKKRFWWITQPVFMALMAHPSDNWMVHVAIELCQHGDTPDALVSFYGIKFRDNKS